MHIVGVENFKWMCETSVGYSNFFVHSYKNDGKQRNKQKANAKSKTNPVSQRIYCL